MKAKLVGWIEKTQGSFGDTVFKEKDGQTHIVRKPSKRKSEYSEKEVATKKRWAIANDYYQYVQLKPELLALYQQASEDTGKTVFMLCKNDWLKPPEITDLKLAAYNGKPGDLIRIWTRDTIGVVDASVKIFDSDDLTVYEQGPAVAEVEGAKFAGFWQYTATASVPVGKSVIVEVYVHDHPGNESWTSGEQKIK
jgi:hypothetical protein